MGPLAGVKVVELVGLAPAPFATTMLADLGADVVRVDRAKPGFDVLSIPDDPLTRSRGWIGVDTKSPAGRDIVLRMVDDADVLIEGFRPGVTERLGIGPEDCLARNPRLVYGRITGWGQDGPLAQAAGHDINYIALSGALEPIGRAGERPVPPRNIGLWSQGRGRNMLDGGAPFYDTYETADGKYVAVGAIEERFWGELVKVLEIEPESVAGRLDPAQWADVREKLAAVLVTRTRDEWAARAEGTDACLTPVLSPEEARDHPHNVARGTFVALDGHVQPAPAPKFSRTAPDVPKPPVQPRSSTDEVLGKLGYSAEDIDRLRTDGVIA
jgi:alpha-methylacyl-CoA racemase